jgi:hypothetical protein
MAVVREVQETGYYVSLYAYTAQNTIITGVSGFPLILQWIDFDTSGPNARQKVVFSLNRSGLRGSYYVGNSTTPDPVKTGRIPVFELVDPDTTNLKFGGGSAFSLPDNGDKFTITWAGTPDAGTIIVRNGSGSISVTKTGNATYSFKTDQGNYICAWNITGAGGTITVTATSSNTKGSWTSETRAAIAAITGDGDGDATLSNGRVLILTVTAKMGTGQQAVSESRVYKILPKPVS